MKIQSGESHPPKLLPQRGLFLRVNWVKFVFWVWTFRPAFHSLAPSILDPSSPLIGSSFNKGLTPHTQHFKLKTSLQPSSVLQPIADWPLPILGLLEPLPASPSKLLCPKRTGYSSLLHFPDSYMREALWWLFSDTSRWQHSYFICLSSRICRNPRQPLCPVLDLLYPQPLMCK